MKMERYYSRVADSNHFIGWDRQVAEFEVFSFQFSAKGHPIVAEN